MGDRGGTATLASFTRDALNYTRWEIGGEPQPGSAAPGNDTDYTRWEIGGEPQHPPRSLWSRFIIPDGRSGGNRNDFRIAAPGTNIIPDGRSGGNRNSMCPFVVHGYDYTRWEIGGEPQRGGYATHLPRIIPDGRSGGNRNEWTKRKQLHHYTRWEIGGEPQLTGFTHNLTLDYTRWEIGGEPQPART